MILIAKNEIFTFHDVSINTNIIDKYPEANLSLHSTMFLLIRLTDMQRLMVNTNFTFHDVSINTELAFAVSFTSVAALHSTMFLLIPVVYSSLQYGYNLTTFCQSCHFIIFILIFIFLDSSHFWNFPDISSIVDLLKFLLYLTSTIIIWNSLNHPSYPKILYPTIFPAEI